MSYQKSNLGKLLNDDTFIYWMKKDDRLSESKKEEWDNWLSLDKRNQDLLRRAKKIIEMPFKEESKDFDTVELLRLKKKR